MIDIAGMRRRALFLSLTHPLPGDGCRGSEIDELPEADRTSTYQSMLQLAWYVHEGVPLVKGNDPVPDCGTDGCLVHLTLDEEQQLVQLVARPSLNVREVFRRGRAAGWFKGVGNYR